MQEFKQTRLSGELDLARSARMNVKRLAQILPQCQFTNFSHFAFPRPFAGSNSLPQVAKKPLTGSAQRVLGKRSKMRKSPAFSLASAVTGIALSVLASAMPAQAQTAADAALDLANMLDGAGGGVSGDAYLSALENAAEAGQPMAMWQLGTMYENGEGVAKDPARAFGYFAQIANQHADAAPRGVESDIVAQSFVKMGDYYRQGVPDAGIPADVERSHALLLHAATYFGDADAQYRVGLLYLQDEGLGVNPLQSARWFSLAARKGHCLAQARLGDMLFNGVQGIEAQPIEGLMWLNVSHTRCQGTADQAQVDEMLSRASSNAQPEDRANAAALAESIAPQFADF
jgi:TPR repeat protein